MTHITEITHTKMVNVVDRERSDVTVAVVVSMGIIIRVFTENVVRDARVVVFMCVVGEDCVVGSLVGIAGCVVEGLVDTAGCVVEGLVGNTIVEVVVHELLGTVEVVVSVGIEVD